MPYYDKQVPWHEHGPRELEAGMQMNAGQSGMALSKESSTSCTSERESEMAFCGVSSSNWRKNTSHLMTLADDIVTRAVTSYTRWSCCRLRLWLLVMFPANFFSFLVDELARLAVWLTVGISTPVDPKVVVT